MAFSGSQDSFSKGSEEDFDFYCDPRSTTGVNTEAKGFCSDCQENLCSACLDAHMRTKAAVHHQLLTKADKKPTKTTTEPKPAKSTTQHHFSTNCTELCQDHQSEVIKFCSVHNAVGCNHCMNLHHMTCKINYILDICYETSKSEEFKKTLQDVAETIDRSEKFTKEVKSTKDANKLCLEEAIREIESFQSEIITRLELLKQTMIQQAQTEIQRQDTIIDLAMSTVVLGSTVLKTMKATMKESQSTIQDARAFVIMKQAQSKLRELNTQSFENDLNKYKIRCAFKPNEVLDDAISSIDGMGKLNVVTDLDLVTRFKSLNLNQTINVRTNSDTKPCDITCCAVLSPDRILLADWNNQKLKILDIVHQIVVGEKTLEIRPCDKSLEKRPYAIAILPQNQAAVSFPLYPYPSEIVIFMTNSQMSTVRRFPIPGNLVNGIAYYQDLLYILCQIPCGIMVLNIQGNKVREIYLQDSKIYSSSLDIAVSLDGQHLYITATNSNVVARVTLQGNVTEVYTNDEMKEPRGLLVLQDGSLLVCCMDSANIYHVSSDLKQGHSLVGSLPKAKSICYHPNSKTFFVGSQDCDQINVFNPK